VEDGVTGFLAQPGDDAALAEAIERLLDDPERARAMGMAGRQRVASRWRWSMVAERLVRLLARCVQAPDAPQSSSAARYALAAAGIRIRLLPSVLELCRRVW